MNFETGTLVSPPKPISRRFTGVNLNYTLSDDWRFMAYHHRVREGQRPSFYILDLDTGTDTEVPELSHFRQFRTVTVYGRTTTHF